MATMVKKGYIMKNIIAHYTNGNYNVSLFSDGTKIRYNSLDFFDAAFPESMDVCITHKCNAECGMCYAGCGPSGEQNDILTPEWLESVHPYTEMAIGGGNIFEHPQLEDFLKLMKNKKVISNITVNQNHFKEHFSTIKNYVDEGLVKAVGVSVFSLDEELKQMLKILPHVVIHLIVGIVDKNLLDNLANNNLKIILLGYKTTGRGQIYSNAHENSILENMNFLKENIMSYRNKFEVISFDNLALEQLEIRRFFSGREWFIRFMGDDGVGGKMTSASMYIDMPTNSFAINSMEEERFEMMNSVDDAFKFLKEKYND